jgi:glutamine amidotransferase-like uncharacterized protein
MDEGWTRFVFEREVAVAYETLRDRDVRAGGLRGRFDAVVLPDQAPAQLLRGHAKGSMPEEYVGGLGEEGTPALRAFVEEGGTLVALGAGALFAVDQLRLPVKNALQGVPAADFYCPGSILAAKASSALPLAHGLPETTPVWFEGSPAFEVEEGKGDAVLRYEDDEPLLSGWLLGRERLKGKAALVDVPLGKGRVVLFGFRPQYRAQSRVTYAALLNALYLSATEP